MVPRISDLLRSFLVLFWGEMQELDDLMPNPVIVFEAFKRSQTLKAWVRFASPVIATKKHNIELSGKVPLLPTCIAF